VLGTRIAESLGLQFTATKILKSGYMYEDGSFEAAPSSTSIDLLGSKFINLSTDIIVPQMFNDGYRSTLCTMNLPSLLGAHTKSPNYLMFQSNKATQYWNSINQDQISRIGFTFTNEDGTLVKFAKWTLDEIAFTVELTFVKKNSWQ
jgi:hypothetical protein